MAIQTLNPPPIYEKVIDENGKITQPWMAWLNALYDYIKKIPLPP